MDFSGYLVRVTAQPQSSHSSTVQTLACLIFNTLPYQSEHNLVAINGLRKELWRLKHPFLLTPDAAEFQKPSFDLDSLIPNHLLSHHLISLVSWHFFAPKTRCRLCLLSTFCSRSTSVKIEGTWLYSEILILCRTSFGEQSVVPGNFLVGWNTRSWQMGK